MAYIGNKLGYKVLDFRGGESQHAFSTVNIIKNVASLDGVDSQIISVSKDKISPFGAAQQLRESIKEGNEYYLGAGQHAAIVRKKNGEYQYLELQSKNDNGWKVLSDYALLNRFNCSLGYTDTSNDAVLINVDSLRNNQEYISILGYINTDRKSQEKGESGHAK